MKNEIKIRGARQHNLKNVDLDIPKNKLVVFTGVSGSGKSSMAFDTIYAEGQRRYVESLSTYARQFLGVMKKPDVDLIEGLSPAISIDQKTTSRNPRSTVGTVTEIYDYMRLLYSRIGHPHCPICGREISSQSVDEIVNSMTGFIKSTSSSVSVARFIVLSPVVVDKKGEFSPLLKNLKAKGYSQIRVDGVVKNLSEDFVLLKTNKHNIDVIVDKFSIQKKDLKNDIFLENIRSRLNEAVEQALELSDGLVILSQILDSSFDIPENPKEFSDHLYSEKFSCPIDNIQMPEIEPRTFSFNSPHGACSTCSGLGKILTVNKDALFSPSLSITEGGILPFKNMFEHNTWYSRLILEVCKKHGINPQMPISSYTKDQLNVLLEGTGDYEYKVEGQNRFGKDTYIYEVFTGLISELQRRYESTESEWVKSEIENYMKEIICPSCNGARLKPESLGVTIDGKSIYDLTTMPISKIKQFISTLNDDGILSSREKQIGKMILTEISARLSFLESVGLEYLTLSRSASSLSGGEAQRIRLASQIGSGLTGVLYVLDEPTIGLHQRDNSKLIKTLKHLKNLGNTVLVVEHDKDMMLESDLIIDFGPGAGKEGGYLVAMETPSDLIKNAKSLTGQYLSGRKKVNSRAIKQEIALKEKITLKNASQFNLKNLTVDFPLHSLVVITGVSGSGKSTLLVETLYPALKNIIDTNHAYLHPEGANSGVEGAENVDKVILIDQSPIGRTPRSNPATYTKVFDHIRDVYAATSDAKAMGYKKGRFSFNVKSGRCEACEGQGQIKIEMQFMSDLWITCDICQGKRYNSQTLEVHYKGKNISEVLEMSVKEAKEFFHAHTPIVSKLETLEAVGLGYMELGQSATTLSGGEAQRVKLATELAKRATGNTVYILDEPTTGLHFADVQRLLDVLKLLVEKGNSVYVIEHNLDIIKNSDWIIDLGPDGGEKGGHIIAQGTLDKIVSSEKSYTGKYLSKE